jgi:hypothetical protein
MPTILDMHGARDIPESVMGKSLVPLLKEDGHHHDGILFGYFGREVNMTDGAYTYHRMPLEGSVCHNHFTDYNQRLGVCAKRPNAEDVSRAEFGHYLRHSRGWPQFRVAYPSGIPPHLPSDGRHLMYRLGNAPSQESPVQNAALEQELTRKLTVLLQEADAPPCQFERLGLEDPATR